MGMTMVERPEPESLFERVFLPLREGLRRRLRRQGARTARGFGMSRAEYEEVLEQVADETLCLAHQNLHTYDPERSPLTWWLYLLGRSVLRKELQQVVRARKSERQAVLQVPREPETPGRELRAVLDRDRLGRALGQLPGDQRRALALFYLMDLDAVQVGRLMGRSPEAVSSLLQRARANALEALEGRPVRRRGRPRKKGGS